MKQDIDREKYVTISQMATLFDGDPSHYAIRRHVENYGQYFDTVFYRGVRYIEKQSGVKVIGVIHNAIRPGRNRGGMDVLDALKTAGIEPVQTQADSDSPVIDEPKPDVAKVLLEIKDVMVEIKDVLKKGG